MKIEKGTGVEGVEGVGSWDSFAQMIMAGAYID